MEGGQACRAVAGGGPFKPSITLARPQNFASPIPSPFPHKDYLLDCTNWSRTNSGRTGTPLLGRSLAQWGGLQPGATGTSPGVRLKRRGAPPVWSNGQPCQLLIYLPISNRFVPARYCHPLFNHPYPLFQPLLEPPFSGPPTQAQYWTNSFINLQSVRGNSRNKKEEATDIMCSKGLELSLVLHSLHPSQCETWG